MWKVINQFLEGGSTLSNPFDIAPKYYELFVYIGYELANKLWAVCINRT